MNTAKLILAISMLSVLVGCEGLIIKPDDNIAASAGKVFSRTILGVGTLGMSEVGIAQIKRDIEAQPRIVTSGSRSSVIKGSKPPYKILVWGNDSIAVGHLTDLFQQLGDAVVSPGRVQALTGEQNIRWTRTSEDAAELLKVAKELQADAIVFADVTGASETRTHVQNRPGVIMPVGNMYLATAPTSQESSLQLHHLRVRVQSVSVPDGAMRWNGTATYDQPVSNPDAGIAYLTHAAVTRALCPNDKDYRWVEHAPWTNGGCLPVK